MNAEWHYRRGWIYWFADLPVQMVCEQSDGSGRQSKGVEQCGGHHALVISSKQFNENQNRGVVIAPLTSARENGKEKFAVPQATWARVTFKGEPAWVLCEQIRYADARRCKEKRDTGVELGENGMRVVDNILRKLLMLPEAVAL